MSNNLVELLLDPSLASRDVRDHLHRTIREEVTDTYIRTKLHARDQRQMH